MAATNLFSTKRMSGFKSSAVGKTGVLRTTVIKTPAVVEAMRTNPDFTIRGMEMGAKMLCETLSNYSDTRNVLADTRNHFP